MKSKITIAIDGFSSTGKSTIAKQLAKHLGYIYVDTGAMYRAIAFFAMQKGFISPEHFDVKALIRSLPTINLQFEYKPNLGFAVMMLNGLDIEKEIRTIEVSQYVSKIAEINEVRTKLVEQQQFMGKDKGIVMDGRDIGTVVFPEAELKLFITASPTIRAQRRFDELMKKGDQVSYAEVYKNVVERDSIDTQRTHSPLVKALDAIEIDNSDLSKDEQFEKIMALTQQALSFV